MLIFLLCIGLYINYYIKSLFINKLIIELVLPLILVNFFFIFYLKNLNLIFFYNFKLDDFFLFFKFIFFIFLFLILLISRNYFIFEKVKIFEYSILILLSVQGSILILLSMNFFLIYVCLEIQNLCFYILATLKRFNNFSVEAGLKYFLFGSFSSSLLLFGISIFYGLFGTLDIFDIFFILLNFNFDVFFILLFLALFFFVVGLLFKLGSAPFHWWIPDVYEGAPSIIMLFFSILPKIVLVFFLIKLNFYLFFFEINISYFFLCLGIFSLIIGSLNTMFQLKIKRFFAYGTIVNIGFLLISLSLMDLHGMFSSIFFLFCYILAIYIFFVFFLSYKKQNYVEMRNLMDLSYFNFNIILLFFLSLIFFSFVGLPPFLGFFGKFFIYFTLLLNYNYVLLIIIFLINVFIGFYYLRVIRFFYFFNDIFEKKNLLILYSFSNLNIIFFTFNIFFLFFFDFICQFIYNLLIVIFLNFI
jgi:NADH-quinone oxidoreductase subunit N